MPKFKRNNTLLIFTDKEKTLDQFVASFKLSEMEKDRNGNTQNLAQCRILFAQSIRCNSYGLNFVLFK